MINAFLSRSPALNPSGVSLTLPFSLAQVPVGQTVLIERMDSEEAEMVAMRLGISPGETLRLAAKIPGGPVVVEKGALEIALGRALCEQILCRPLTQPVGS